MIGAVLIPGARAPKLITREMLTEMKPGAVFCDVAIDQGGCAETSKPTTHSEPVYVVEGVTHYCVANMPGAVPITSTKALTNATLPYVEAVADFGLAEAVGRDPALAGGVNVLDGKVTHPAVAEAHGLEYAPLADVLPRPGRRKRSAVRTCTPARQGESSRSSSSLLCRAADTLCARCSGIGPKEANEAVGDRAAALLRITAAIDDYLYTNEHLPDGSRRSVFSGPNRERLMGGSVLAGRRYRGRVGAADPSG